MFNSQVLQYRLRRRIDKIRGKRITDDFDWRLYNTHYRGELVAIAKDHTAILKKGDYVFQANALVKDSTDLLPLHPNHRLLYETIAQLKPSSVFELGCGGGDHLHNIGLLLGNIKLSGVDLSYEQLEFLKERHPDLSAVTGQYDCTLPFPSVFPAVDVAYTQAVLMHIQTGNGHLVALSNLFRLATKQVVLMENWTRHEFVDDIRTLHALKVVPWEDIYFYYRDSEEFRKPHLLIVSSVPLGQYKVLTDFAMLRDGARA